VAAVTRSDQLPYGNGTHTAMATEKSRFEKKETLSLWEENIIIKQELSFDSVSES
jgi:hypothetical protein